MQEISLAGTVWGLDETRPLGPPGGFGAVFLGHSETRGPVAIKRLHLEAKGAREVEIADFLLNHSHPHVIPIYAAGTDAATGLYFIVMARADQSLQDLIERSAPLQEVEALEIAEAILGGLHEISELVHRDLKPGNVLLHNGVWKLADLGLARFVEAATASNTMKDFLSPQYAAPEQWRGERATKATDVYALGCIIYALLTAKPPFSGGTHADLAEQHQLAAPSQLPASPALRRIATECLAKNATLRPTVPRLQTQLARARLAAGNPRPSPIAKAAAAIAEKVARESAQEEFDRRLTADREAIAREAVAVVRQLLEGLVDRVLEDAPNATRDKSDHQVVLGTGYIDYKIEFPFLEARKVFGDRKWDVIAGAVLEVGMTYWSSRDVTARSANLWFGRLDRREGYRWWEVSYASTPERQAWMTQHNIRGLHLFGFHATTSYGENGLDSLLNLPSWYSVATNPRPVDGELIDEFYERWLTWLSQAALDVNIFRSPPTHEEIAAKFR